MKNERNSSNGKLEKSIAVVVVVARIENITGTEQRKKAAEAAAHTLTAHDVTHPFFAFHSASLASTAIRFSHFM